MKLRNSESDIYAMLSGAYVGEALKRSSVYEWHKRFEEGGENVEDDEPNVIQDLTTDEYGAFR